MDDDRDYATIQGDVPAYFKECAVVGLVLIGAVAVHLPWNVTWREALFFWAFFCLSGAVRVAFWRRRMPGRRLYSGGGSATGTGRAD